MGKGSLAKTKTDGPTPIGECGKQIGIILVPGVMGSRLVRMKNKKANATWDPPWINETGEDAGKRPPPPGWTGWETGSGELYIDINCFADQGWTMSADDLPSTYEHVAHHIGHANGQADQQLSLTPPRDSGTVFSVHNSYYKFVFSIADLYPRSGYLSETGYSPKVYCAGYDFRQDNGDSAATLARVVNKALAECDHDKVILICHSMGGLVARHYARTNADKVQAVFLVGSPSFGAPESYLYLKSFHNKILATILGYPTLAGAQKFSRENMPAMYQLAPTDMYAFASKNYRWLEFHADMAKANKDTQIDTRLPEEEQAPRDCTDLKLLYRNLHTGFMEHGDLGIYEQQRRYLNQAFAFHTHLAACDFVTMDQPSAVDSGEMTINRVWMHPRTYIAYSTNHDTIERLEIQADGDVIQHTGPGDASVPAVSGEAPDDFIGPFVDGRSPVIERHEISGREQHQDLLGASDVIAWIKDKIIEECAEL